MHEFTKRQSKTGLSGPENRDFEAKNACWARRPFKAHVCVVEFEGCGPTVASHVWQPPAAPKLGF